LGVLKCCDVSVKCCDFSPECPRCDSGEKLDAVFSLASLVFGIVRNPSSPRLLPYRQQTTNRNTAATAQQEQIAFELSAQE
jgi:hypothetical protein